MIDLGGEIEYVYYEPVIVFVQPADYRLLGSSR